MNSIRDTSCSFNLCNLSYYGTNQIIKRFNVVIFTLYNAKVSSWSNYATPITIATGLPWSGSFGFSALHCSDNNTQIAGHCKMCGSDCQVNLASNSTFDLCHIYQI